MFGKTLSHYKILQKSIKAAWERCTFREIRVLEGTAMSEVVHGTYHDEVREFPIVGFPTR